MERLQQKYGATPRGAAALVPLQDAADKGRLSPRHNPPQRQQLSQPRKTRDAVTEWRFGRMPGGTHTHVCFTHKQAQNQQKIENVPKKSLQNVFLREGT